MWRHEELERISGETYAGIFNFYFGITREGNVLTDPHGEFTQKNILAVAKSLEETATHFKKSPQAIEDILAWCKRKLFKQRFARPRPFLDDKILTDWNGLMISSLAFAARVFGEPRYRIAAGKAMEFIMHRLLTKEGRFAASLSGWGGGHAGDIERLRLFIQGLLDLYEASFDPTYLQCAQRLSAIMIDLFWDESGMVFI